MFYDNYQRTTDDLLTNGSLDQNGWNFQAGYFLYKRKFEVVARVERIDPNESVADDFLKEWGIAANYFYNKHNLKLQGDYRRIENEAKNTEFDEYRIQLQFIF